MTLVSPKRALALVLALGVAASLAACAPEKEEAAPSATPTVEPTETAAPPTAQRPRLAELVLTTEGLGDLQFGAAPPTEDPATALASYDDDACVGTGTTYPGLWTANYPDIDEGDGPRAPFAIQVTDDLITRIDVNTSGIITEDGLGIGSSLDAVLGTYPGGPDEVINSSDVSEVYVFTGTAGKLLFEVAKGDMAGYWEDDVVGTVVYLSAVSIDTAAFAKAGTDNTIGVCNNA